jgi:hypothetical protein
MNVDIGKLFIPYTRSCSHALVLIYIENMRKFKITRIHETSFDFNY